jgi:hypothetical protein
MDKCTAMDTKNEEAKFVGSENIVEKNELFVFRFLYVRNAVSQQPIMMTLWTICRGCIH